MTGGPESASPLPFPDSASFAPSFRVLAYCHDSVGIGHLRRTMAICERIGAEHATGSFLLATGTPYVPLFSPVARSDYIKLPALAKMTNGDYACKYLGLPLSQLIKCREALLLQTARHFEPDLLLVDKAPVGVCRELVPVLEWMRRHRPRTRVVFGMRDIEDDPPATIRQWAADGVLDMLDRCYDEIWIYGSRDVFDPVTEYELPANVRAKVRFMGYVARAACTEPHVKTGATPNVLVTVGGGTDGEMLLDGYLAEAADRVAEHGWRSVIVGGPDLPAAAADRIQARCGASDALEWIQFERCMSCRIRAAGVVVTMGGYNTLCEVAVHEKRALIVPRVKPRLEQAIRAERWAALCGFSVLNPRGMTPADMSREVLRLIRYGRRPASVNLDLTGLDRVARRVSAILEERTVHAAAVRL